MIRTIFLADDRQNPPSRPISVPSAASLRMRCPTAIDRQAAARAVELDELRGQEAIALYDAARADLAELNRRRRWDRHDPTIARMISETFGTLNLRRASVLRVLVKLADSYSALARLSGEDE